jgi:predicted enzyme related to lactoylglutathione lyase
MEIKGLIEVILYVRDMAVQAAFYRDVLGLRVSAPGGVTDYSQQHWVTFDTGACLLALHMGGKGDLGKDAPKIVFQVDDILAGREQLALAGVKISPVRLAAPGIWVADGCDPEGNLFSIEQKDR